MKCFQLRKNFIIEERSISIEIIGQLKQAYEEIFYCRRSVVEIKEK